MIERNARLENYSKNISLLGNCGRNRTLNIEYSR
jgi:hypothetical protein